MENEKQQTTTGEAQPTMHPLIKQFIEPTRVYFEKMNDFSDQWDDAASDRFKDTVVNHCRKTTWEFIQSLAALTDGYEQILQQAKSLLDCKAGFGGFLSIIDIEMLAERQVSRWLFNRDDQRW